MNTFETEGATVVRGKETLIRRRGADWSFHLAARHTVELTDDRRYVTLSAPLGGLSLFRVDRIDETDPEEVVIFVGDQHAQAGPATFGDEPVEPMGYPLVEHQDEIERLRQRWRSAGLADQEFNAYGRGESHDDRLKSIRRTLRAIEHAPRVGR